MKSVRVLPLCVSILLSGCGGGGGISSSSVPGISTPTAAPNSGTSVSFTIAIPKSSGAALVRRPEYVSTNTESISIQQLSANAPYTPVGQPVVANVTAGSAGCSTTSNQVTCSITFAASPGTFNFSVQSYAGTNGTGALLAENTLSTTTIVAGVANSLSVTLNGVIGSLSVPSSVAGTVAFSQTITFSVQDPTGATIIGTGTYDNGPLTVTDLSGYVALSPTSFAGPSNASSLRMLCNAAGTGTIQFADAGAVLGSLNYTCSPNTITLSPGGLDFDALAASQTDPTYDQLVTVSDLNTGVESQTPMLSCTPGQGAVSSTIALAIAGTSGTYAIRPLDVGTCTFAVQDQLANGGMPTSQVISIEIHSTTLSIDSRRRRPVR